MPTQKLRAIQTLAIVCFGTGVLVLGAHIGVESLRLEPAFRIAVYVIGAVGAVTGLFALRLPADTSAAPGASPTVTARRVSRLGLGSVVANVLLVGLTLMYGMVALMLPDPSFDHAVGERLPEFKNPLVDVDGRKLTVADLEGEATLLLFYRGGWCPFCRAQLTGLHERFDEISAGARIVAVSPDLSDTVKAYANRFELAFTLASDEGAEVAEAYGLAMEDPFHGKVSHPATILLDRDGRIAWFHVADDIADRPSPEEILEQVGRLRRTGP